MVHVIHLMEFAHVVEVTPELIVVNHQYYPVPIHVQIMDNVIRQLEYALALLATQDQIAIFKLLFNVQITVLAKVYNNNYYY